MTLLLGRDLTSFRLRLRRVRQWKRESFVLIKKKLSLNWRGQAGKCKHLKRDKKHDSFPKKKRRKETCQRGKKKQSHSWLHCGTTGVPHIAGMKRAVLMLLDSGCCDPPKDTVQNTKMLQRKKHKKIRTSVPNSTVQPISQHHPFTCSHTVTHNAVHCSILKHFELVSGHMLPNI